METTIADDTSSLKSGDSIWLNFSRNQYYLEARLTKDCLTHTLNSVLDQIKNRSLKKSTTNVNIDASVDSAKAVVIRSDRKLILSDKVQVHQDSKHRS